MSDKVKKTPTATYQKPTANIVNKKIYCLGKMRERCESNLIILEEAIKIYPRDSSKTFNDGSMLNAYEEPLVDGLSNSKKDYLDYVASINTYFELLLMTVGFSYKSAANKYLRSILVSMVLMDYTSAEAILYGCKVTDIDERIILSAIINEYIIKREMIDENVYKLTGVRLPEKVNIVSFVRVLFDYFCGERAQVEKMKYNNINFNIP